MYSPDFILRTADRVYVIETKAQRDVSSANVQRKRKAAKAWCDRVNLLESEQRDHHTWHYVILGENAVHEWKGKNARVTELLDYARIADRETVNQERLI